MSELRERPDGTIALGRVLWWVLLVGLGIELALVAADLGLVRSGWISGKPFRHLLSVAREDGLANWFSSAQTLLVALVLGLIRLRAGARGAGRWQRLAWSVLALFFLLMAVDDGVALHERVGTWVDHLRASHPGGRQGTFPVYSWLVVLGPGFVATGLFMLVFLWRQLAGNARVLLFAALTCLGFAMGLDAFEGRMIAAPGGPSVESVRYAMQLVEELAEMFANTLLLVVFLGKLAELSDGLVLRLARPEP